MTATPTLDTPTTTRSEPPLAGDETATLLGSLERQRTTFAWKEYARHVGHADLLRESVDGPAGEDPPADVAGYPPLEG